MLLLSPIALSRGSSGWKQLFVFFNSHGSDLHSFYPLLPLLIKVLKMLFVSYDPASLSAVQLCFLYGYWPITVNRCAALTQTELTDVLLPEKMLLFQWSKRNSEHLDPSKEHLTLCFTVLPGFSSFHIMSLMKLYCVGDKAIAVYQALWNVQKLCQNWEAQVLVNWLYSELSTPGYFYFFSPSSWFYNKAAADSADIPCSSLSF